MIKKFFISLIFVFLFTSYLFAGQIKDVIYEADTLKIQLTEKTEYKIISQDDPFKIRIEFVNTEPGTLERKMFFHEGLISEISAQVVGSNTQIEILLAEPFKYEVKMEDSVLIISQTETEKTVASKIIDLTMNETGEGFEISIQGDGELPEPYVKKVDGYINVSFHGVKLDTEPSENIPLSVKREGDELTLSFFFGKDFTVQSLYLGDEVILDIKKFKEQKVSMEQPVSEPPARKIVSEEKTISLDLQDADIVGVFRLIGDISGFNIIIHPDVKGKITLKLINVPWLQALDVICKTFMLEKLFEGNIIRIAPVKVFQEEKKLEAETKDLFKKVEEEQIRIFVLKYASVDKVKSTIETSKILSPKGNISTDERTRTIIVKDIPSVLQQVASLVAELDKPTRQILLEARIVEISSSFSKALGFEWGIKWQPPDTRTTIVGSVGAAAGGSASSVPGGTAELAVNLPASTGTITAPTTAFTVGYLNPTQTFALDLRISALQQSGKGKVISNPKVITLDNQKAKIIQGASIPYGEKDVQSGQVSTKFKDVAITVEATPHLIDDKSMLLDLNVVKEDLVEFVNIGGVYAPRTLKIEGNTKVSLKDGETLVIGGIYKKTDSVTESKVPGLGDVPLLGELFKSRGRDETLYEVMIFITPRILTYE